MVLQVCRCGMNRQPVPSSNISAQLSMIESSTPPRNCCTQMFTAHRLPPALKECFSPTPTALSSWPVAGGELFHQTSGPSRICRLAGLPRLGLSECGSVVALKYSRA